MSDVLKLSLPPATRLAVSGPNQYTIESPGLFLKIPEVTSGIMTALRMLVAGDTTEEELVHAVISSEGIAGLSMFYLCFCQLRDSRLLCQQLTASDGSRLTFIPISLEYSYEPCHSGFSHRFILSRFAYAHRYRDQLVLESPLSFAKLVLTGSATGTVLSALMGTCTFEKLHSSLSAFTHQSAKALLERLWSAHLLAEVQEDGTIAEDVDDSLRQWEFHDLLFHARSRQGRHSNPYGGVYPFAGIVDPLPTIKKPQPGARLDLRRADIEKLKASDLPLTYVLETRRSLRHHSSPPLTLNEIGEFLYRTVRIRNRSEGDGQEIAERVFPAGGAVHELEIYLIVNECDGCIPGFYAYCPLEHQLVMIRDPNADTEKLLQSAGQTARSTPPQLLIILSARFRRMSFKYCSISYATILKDVGVLFQTMYLVATSMGLAACALGGGNSDVFARAAGLRYEDETSVGEFIVGRR